MLARSYMRLGLVLFMGVVACSASEAEEDGPSDSFRRRGPAETSATQPEASASQAEAARGNADAADSRLENPWGFPLRKPQTRSLKCRQGYVKDKPPEPVNDRDHVCSFTYGGVSGVLYLQATATACVYDYEVVGEFSSRVWLSVDGKVTELADTSYSAGGDHHNDSLEFMLQGQRMRLNRSTFNEGYRGCQPMDCLEVYDAKDRSRLVEDGCTRARSLPVTCVLVREDGSVPPLDAPFALCPDGWPLH